MRHGKLEDLFDYLPKSKIKAGDGLEKGEYPFYTSSDIQSKYLDDFQHEPGCLVFGTGGKASVHLTTRRFTTSTDCITIKPKASVEIDLGYVFQYFRGNMQVLENGFKGAGLKHISKAYLSEIKIPYPEDIREQQRIAHLLGKVEALIAQRKQHLQQLDDLLKSVFLEMFGDPVGAEQGRVLTTIGDSVEIQSGQVDPRELPYSEMFHVGGANIESETGNFLNLQQAKYESLISGKYLFDSSYILYSKIRPYLNKVSKPNFQGICSADIYPIRPVAGLLNRDFLRLLLMSKGFLSYTSNNSDRANIPKINRKALIAFSFYRPSIEAQHQFSIVVEKVEGLRLQSQQSLMDLEALYGALSQRAFNGDLDLSLVPNVHA